MCTLIQMGMHVYTYKYSACVLVGPHSSERHTQVNGSCPVAGGTVPMKLYVRSYFDEHLIKQFESASFLILRVLYVVLCV